MVKNKTPLLLSFYAMSNGEQCTLLGQLTFTKIKDLSFTNYNRRKTFRTLFKLYRTRPLSNHTIILNFDEGSTTTTTNTFGAFYIKSQKGLKGNLVSVTLGDGENVQIVEGLYGKSIHYVDSRTIVVSDIDDTLIHSFIYRKIRKFRTLMFTTMEKRKAVTNMQELIMSYVNAGAQPVYLSNSEQNLYPIIYRFLRHNKFPAGPVYLKQLRTLWDVLLNIKFPLKNLHKMNVLEDLIHQFPGRKFVFMGDNTQQDLSIYLTIAKKYPHCVHSIIIRKVIETDKDQSLIESHRELLDSHKIPLHYSQTFPLYAQAEDDA